MSRTFLLEPDVIAATENILPDLNNDLILAKNYLKQQSAATGDSMYDHLVDLVHKMLSQKPPDIVDTFEQYSYELKEEKFRPNFDLLHDIYLNPPQLALIRRLDGMVKLIASKAKKFDEIGEEEELDLEEDHETPFVADLVDHNYYFREAGYGLPASECYAVFIALKMLAVNEPVAKVRFFGKIFGTKKNYYVAETDVTLNELDRRIREYELRFMKGEEEAAIEEKPPEEEQKEILGEGEAKVPTEPVPPKLPPIPESTWMPPPPIPEERPGSGVNKKFYYVCNAPGEDWICLPDVTPQQLRVARQIVHCVTGDLEAEIQTFPPFEGTERNFLRAQIARIQAATSVAPQGFYTFGSGEEEEDVDMEEGMGDLEFNPNPYYHGHTMKDLLDTNFTYWVHHGRHILKQGRTLWWNPNADMEEALEEEDDEAMPPILPESGPPLMTPLSEDARVEGMTAWVARCSTKLAPERAIAVLRSNVWPGAVAYAFNKKSECMYIGWGLKYLPPNYSPPQLPRVQEEYPIGPEIMEMADPTFADEEAYRIAHLPPPPPVIPAEEELMGPEEEEEED